jgi:hypothetical protein
MPDERRGWAIGVFSTGGTVFLIFGPLIGAAILALGDWRWLFVLNLPVLAFALVQAIRWLQPSRDPEPGLDIAAMLLLLVGLPGTVLSLSQISNWGAAVPIPLVAGVTLLRSVRVHAIAIFPATDSAGAATESPRDNVVDRVVRDPIRGPGHLGVSRTVPPSRPRQHCDNRRLGAGVDRYVHSTSVRPYGVPLPTDGEPERWCSRVWYLACVGLAWTGVAAQKLSLAWLIPGLLVFGVARPAIFTPASGGPFIALPGEHLAFAASLVTEARQL